MSLTSCLTKTGAYLPESDKASLKSRALELGDTGLSPAQAADEAVDELIETLQAELATGLAAAKLSAPRTPATLDDFKKENIKGILEKDDWTIITAENPNATSADDAFNSNATSKLQQDLDGMGVDYLPTIGRYESDNKDENSFTVVGIKEEEAKQLGIKHGQHSVLTRRGYVYQDGSVNPATSVTVLTKKPKQYYSQIGNAIFRIEIDFDTKIQPDVKLSPPRTVAQDVAQTLGPVARFLLPAEKSKLRRDTSKRLVGYFKVMPSSNETAAIAFAGKAKRGWYVRAAESIVTVFGYDAPRFIALVAALSPQQSVETNLRNALSVWKNWILADRPTSRKEILAVMARSVDGTRGDESVMRAWRNNSVSALSSEDPAALILSGPKVTSFMLNLRGFVNEVTNDAWMANFAGVGQKIFAGEINKSRTDPGKGPGYLAMSAHVREAADILTKLTGETWTPMEVQETVWSWSKTVYEAQTADKGARELLKDGTITDALIASTPDFSSLLWDETNERHLTDAGYGEQLFDLANRELAGASEREESRARRQTSPFDRDTQARYEQRAAKRLEELKYGRDVAETETRATRAASIDDEWDGVSLSPPRDQTDTPAFKKWSKGYDVVRIGTAHKFKPGEPIVVEALHGTTFGDIMQFKRDRSDPSSNMGAGFYATNSPEDVSLNYASETGPDITNKIDSMRDALFDSMVDDGMTEEEADTTASGQAREAISGGQPNTMKLFMRFDKPAIIGPDKARQQTFLSYEHAYDEETDTYNEPTGELMDFIAGLRDIANEYGATNAEINHVVGRLMEEALDDGIAVSAAIDIIKHDIESAENDDGRSVSAEIARLSLEAAGYDGIIDTTVRTKFKGMKGLTKDTVHFVAFHSDKIKSATGNIGTFDDTSNISQSPPRPMFYSQLERAIEQVPDRLATMAAPQWKLWLDANAGKLGVKKDEIEWSGITDYLALRGKDQVTRDELVQYMQTNGVRVAETMLGKKGATEEQSDAALEAIERNDNLGYDYANQALSDVVNEGDDWTKVWPDVDAKDVKSIQQYVDAESAAKPTKFARWTVPGGTNHRELAMTLPFREPKIPVGYKVEETEYKGQISYFAHTPTTRSHSFKTRAEAEADLQKSVSGLKDFRANLAAYRVPTAHEMGGDADINRLFHARVDDRTNAEGKKILFVHELQSDWSQEGRAKGFQDPKAPRPAYDALRAFEVTLPDLYDTWLRQELDGEFKDPARMDRQVAKHKAGASPGDMSRILGDEVRSKHNALIRARNTEDDVRDLTLPAAPFVQKTEAWVALAIKRIIILAANEGYDQVAFINGEQAADLYGLSKQVSSIEWSEHDKTAKMVTIRPIGGNAIEMRVLPDGQVTGMGGGRIGNEFDGKKIDAIVGKAVGEKILADKRGELSGDGLKIGGEGMRAFYGVNGLVTDDKGKALKDDKGKDRVAIVPIVITDVLKKLGGDGLTTSTVMSKDERNALLDLRQDDPGFKGSEGTPQSGFAITDAMREKVSAGVSLFSPPRDQTDTPEFKKWFGDSKVVDGKGQPLVVYHGTEEDFTEFKYGEFGFHFGGKKQAKKRGETLMPVYLRIEKPIRFDTDFNLWDDDVIAPYLVKKGIITRREADAGDLQGLLMAKGFDGYSYPNSYEGGGLSYAVFSPEQIKSATGNRGTFDPINPDITKSPPREAFLYSALERMIETAPDRIFNMPAVGLTAWIKNNAAQNETKKDEIYWSGIENYLTLQGKNKVSKADVLAYLDANNVKVVDVVLGEDLSDVEAWWNDEGGANEETPFSDLSAAERREATQQYRTDVASYAEDGAKHASGNLVLPGGTNQRETVVTIPRIRAWGATDVIHYGDTGKGKQIAWVRTNDRTDASGADGRFIEEIQSKRAMEGKKEGFGDVLGYRVIEPSGQLFGEYRARFDAEDALARAKPGSVLEQSDKVVFDGIPPAPFITTADNKASTAYIALLMKKAVLQAINDGKTWVAWTTAAQQSERYRIDKEVESIEWSGGYKSDTRMVEIYMIEGDAITLKTAAGIITESSQDGLVGKDLSELVGKEIAAQIRKDGAGELRGEGLKIDPAWTKGMYGDEKGLNAKGELSLMAQAANDILKKLGGGKVETIAVDAGQYNQASQVGDAAHAAEVASGLKAGALMAQPGFHITPAMADKARTTGLTLFSPARDQTATPAFKKWFGGSKVVDTKGRPLVVYHGTQANFSDFRKRVPRRNINNAQKALGFFFTDSTDYVSDSYAAEEGSLVMPVYLSMQNPAYRTMADIDRIENGSERNARAWRKRLEDKGHDGIIFMDEQGGGEFQEYVVFKPTQIKSSIGNRGTFDPANPNITQSPARDAFNKAINAKPLSIVGATSRVYTPEQLANMREVGMQTEAPSIKERYETLTQGFGKFLAQGIFDQFAPIKALGDHAYRLTRLSKGASGAFESFLHGGKLKLEDGVYDFDETNKGGVIDTLLVPMGGEHHDLFRWIAANRAERLMAEGKEHLFTKENIKVIKTLSDGNINFDFKLQHGANAGKITRNRAEMYADSLITFNAFNKNILDMAEQSGLIDADSRAMWEHEFYVPFYRVADDVEGGVRGFGGSNALVRQQAFKKLKGGKNALNADLLDNTLMNWAHLLDASAKNRAARATLEAAVRLGVAVESDPTTIKLMGKDAKTAPVWFVDGGKQRHFIVEDVHLLTAISSLEYAGMKNPVMNAMGFMKHMLTMSVTASPFFKVKNLIRDSVQVLATSPIGLNPLGNVAEGFKLTKPGTDAYYHLLAGGGTIHFGAMLEGNESKRVQGLVDTGVAKATILNDEKSMTNFYRKVLHPLWSGYNELGNRGEAVNRAALYNQLRKNGMSHGEASLAARDLMDFSLQGSFTSIRFLSQVVPFFNARLQGMYKLGRAGKEDPKRMAVVLGAVAMASIALLAAYGDDDDWKKREEWDRNTFWWFKIGGIAYRIPKPFEIGAIATLAERGFEFMFDKEMTGQRLRSQVLTILGDNLSMNPIPQLFKPILEVYSNKASFTGRPIESMGMERLTPEYRFGDRTSMLARGIGSVNIEGLSPAQVDAMLRSYFGWVGTFLIGISEHIARPITDQPVQARPDLFKLATGNMISQLDTAPSRYVTQMYEQSKTIDQAYNTWRMLQKAGKVEEAAEFRIDNLDEINKRGRVQGIKELLSNINARIRVIERSTTMSADEKREALRRLQAQKDAASRRFTPG